MEVKRNTLIVDSRSGYWLSCLDIDIRTNIHVYCLSKLNYKFYVSFFIYSREEELLLSVFVSFLDIAC